MLNENHSSTPWKNKLEDGAALSGELLLDKEAAWNKLNQRMHRQVRNRRAVWYLAAAACILLAIAIPFLTTQKPQVTVVQHATPKATKKQVEQMEVLPVEKKPVAAPVLATTTKKRTPRLTKQTNDAIVTEVIQHTEIQEETVDSVASLPAPIIQDPITTIAVVQPKRKLKVVHINELGDPVETSDNIVRASGSHSFELKLANGEVLNNPPVAYNKASFTVIKFKSSPTN